MLKRKESPTKRPSMPKVGTKPSSLSQRNGFPAPRGDVSMPKTRFTLTDGSNSSPRLKSFPAEKIKRVEFSPPRNSPNVSNGQGDTLQPPSVQFHLDVQPETIRNPNISSISEQQVPRSIYPLSKQVNYSELVIPSAIENCSMGRVTHRPFVPNIPQTNLTLRDHSPKKATSPRLLGPSQAIHPSQLSRRVKCVAQSNQHDPWNVDNNSVKPMDSGNESMEDRYAAFHRGNTETRANHNRDTREPIQPMRSIIRGSNVSNLCPLDNSTGWQNSQQHYHPYQPNMLRYYNANNQVEMPRARIIEQHPGMTSPQDVAVNHVQNYQRIVQHDPHGWTQRPHSSYIRNQQDQTQPYSMNIVTPEVNVTPNSHAHYHYPQHGTQGPDSHRHAPARCSQQQQQFCHSGELLSMTLNQSANATNKLASGNSHKRGNIKRNSLRFSQPMIRDQEMLVTTMRQQGIPEDIMRRQFDALLAEQRKQLLYLEQLELGDSNSTDKLQPRHRVQRKISRIEEDGKPEWMLHITPPRIPYNTIEKVRYEEEVRSQQSAPNNGNALQPRKPGDPHEIIVQANLSNYQEHTNDFENWQRQAPHTYVCNNSNVPQHHQRFDVNSNSNGDNGHKMYKSYQIQYPHQTQLYAQQTQEKLQLQGQDSNARDELQRTKGYEEPEKKIEPSSLYKLRLYKEVVRKRKQNNGLQDSETVKEAMEALKNPVNRRGLEYLENLNKKRAKPLSLNGAQDPLFNGPRQQYISLNCQQAKVPSANGLENHRNSNNPPPSTTLRQRKLENRHFDEYPRQRTCNVSRDSCSLMAERENGTVANSLTKEYHQQATTAMENPIGAFQHMQSSSKNTSQFLGQTQQDTVYKDQQIMPSLSPSMPFASNEQSQPIFHGAPIEQYYENRDKYGRVNSVNPTLTTVDSTRFAEGAYVNGINADFQEHHCYPPKFNDLHETMTIGGIKYLARKREYIPNSSMLTFHHNQTNPGTYFNPMISCQ